MYARQVSSASAPSCDPVAADKNVTDRLAIERGENEGMPVRARKTRICRPEEDRVVLAYQ